MIKWTATKNGRTTLGLGLEPGNLTLLKAGRPILIDGAKLGLPIDIAIHYGDSKEKMIAQFRDAGVELPPEKDWIKP